MMGLSGWAASVMSVASDVAASALSHRCIASAVDLRAVMSVITPTCTQKKGTRPQLSYITVNLLAAQEEAVVLGVVRRYN